jgi:hypothetical protein
MTDTSKHATGDAMEPPSTENRSRCAPQDVELLAHIRAGDQRACEALVRQHGGRMQMDSTPTLQCHDPIDGDCRRLLNNRGRQELHR